MRAQRADAYIQLLTDLRTKPEDRDQVQIKLLRSRMDAYASAAMRRLFEQWNDRSHTQAELIVLGSRMRQQIGAELQGDLWEPSSSDQGH